MKSLCLRLIYRGKIVGHQWHYYESMINNRIVIMEAVKFPISEQDVVTCITTGECSQIVYDSFDLGIKFGEEWFFNNDVVLSPDFNSEWILHIDIGQTMWLEQGNNAQPIYRLVDAQLKRIGTIYDKDTE